MCIAFDCATEALSSGANFPQLAQFLPLTIYVASGTSLMSQLIKEIASHTMSSANSKNIYSVKLLKITKQRQHEHKALTTHSSSLA